MKKRRRSGERPAALPKLCGADVELGNFILGIDRTNGTGAEAARALLARIQGVSATDRYRWRTGAGQLAASGAPGLALGTVSAPPRTSSAGSAYSDPQDWGRKYLPANGGCIYIDLDHLELCLPEVLSAWDHVACWRAMLSIAREAQRSANARLPQGASIKVLVNNSDRLGHSYGSHLNVLVTRQTWERLFHRKLHHGLFLATHQITSLIFTGQGKVGSENGAPPCRFQVAQRADFFETLSGSQTTFRRPILNTRDEPLAGSEDRRAESPARVHVIFYDSNLCEVASLLKIGSLQIVLAMLEAGEVDLNLILDDPVAAGVNVSHDLTLKATLATLTDERMSALEIQWQILARAERFVKAGRCGATVPRAPEVISLWKDTLLCLERGDFATLARRLDWVLKLSLLERLRREREIDWDAPVLKHLDQAYSSLDPEDGLFWAYDAAGLVERVVPPERVAHFRQEPPEDTRAWGRCQLLRRLGSLEIEDIDWDHVRVRSSRNAGRQVSLSMSDPFGFTRQAVQATFESEAASEELLLALGGEESNGSRPLAPTCLQVEVVAAERGNHRYDLGEGREGARTSARPLSGADDNRRQADAAEKTTERIAGKRSAGG
jgi:hypothetical protein